MREPLRKLILGAVALVVAGGGFFGLYSYIKYSLDQMPEKAKHFEVHVTTK